VKGTGDTHLGMTVQCVEPGNEGAGFGDEQVRWWFDDLQLPELWEKRRVDLHQGVEKVGSSRRYINAVQREVCEVREFAEGVGELVGVDADIVEARLAKHWR